MPSNPWFKFYPTDWQSDQALRICSIAARGVWLEMICVMHKADPYGHLVINGRTVTNPQLALLSGVAQIELEPLLTELEEAGVFSRNRAGVIYSRRMTRDEKKRKDGEKSAKSGTLPNSRRGNQGTERKQEKSPPPRVEGDEDSQPPLPQKPDARSQKLDIKNIEDKSSIQKKGSSTFKLTDFGIVDQTQQVEIVKPEKSADNPDFNEWWNEYPKKVARQRALKAYASVVSSGKANPADLLLGVRRYASERARHDPKFTKHPATWLNSGCWTDEPEAPPPDAPLGCTGRMKAYKKRNFANA